jgi:hypothetical protein
MRTLQLNDVVQVRLWTTATDQAAVNTFYYAVTLVGGTPATDQDLVDTFDTTIAIGILPMLDVSSLYNGCQAKVIVSGGIEIDPIGVASTTGSAAGTATGVNQSRQTAGINTWLTNKSGPANRGRTYWPFPAVTADTTDGVPTAAYLALMTTLCQSINNFDLVTGTTTTIQQVLFRKGKPHNVPPIPFSDDDITGYIVRPKWATQRRRGSYGRQNVSPI